jgi:hypothetical protein
MTRLLSGALLGAMIMMLIFCLGVPTSGVSPSFAQGSPFERKLEELILSRSESTRVLGFVQGEQFAIIHPEKMTRKQLRLTTVASREAKIPEQGLVDLSPYEGQVIMVEGVDTGRWLYEAKVIDRASPIMLTVISELFAGARLRRLQ